MQLARTLSSPARVALYGGIGNETPWGVEADELFRKPVKKNPSPKAEILTAELLERASESVTQAQEPSVPITD